MTSSLSNGEHGAEIALRLQRRVVEDGLDADSAEHLSLPDLHVPRRDLVLQRRDTGEVLAGGVDLQLPQRGEEVGLGFVRADQTGAVGGRSALVTDTIHPHRTCPDRDHREGACREAHDAATRRCGEGRRLGAVHRVADGVGDLPEQRVDLALVGVHHRGPPAP